MKELRDQLAHAGVAILCLLPVALVPCIPTGAVSGFLLGLIREVTEEGDPVTPAKIRAAIGSIRDLSFWALGGAIVGAIA